MNKVTVSIALRQGLVAILIVENGTLKRKVVKKILEERIKTSSYLSAIHGLTLSLREVRKYIEDNKDSRDICFEISNVTLTKWLENQYSKEQYQEEFTEALRLLNELPIRYYFKYNRKPMALAYAKPEYLEKKKLSGLEIME